MALLSVALVVAFLGPSRPFERAILSMAGERSQPGFRQSAVAVPAGDLSDALLRELRSPAVRGGRRPDAQQVQQRSATATATAPDRAQSAAAEDLRAFVASPDPSLTMAPTATPLSDSQTDPAGEPTGTASEPEANREEAGDAATSLPVDYAVDPNPAHWAFLQAAVGPAQDSQRETGVPASVTIAQAIHESAWGTSRLSREANNYFGIKANGKPGSRGAVVMKTGEFLGGANVTVKDAFRAYNDMTESFVDHGRFLKENARYAKAMANAQDPRVFIRLIAQAGYATDPAYASKVLKYMDRYDLYQYDLD